MKVADTEINFKPEFGNPEHLRVLELVDIINTLYRTLQKKIEAAQNVRSLKSEIDTRVRDLYIVLEQIQNKKGA